LERADTDVPNGEPERKRRVSKFADEETDHAYRTHLRNLGCSKRAIETIIKLWKEKMRRVEGPEAFCLILHYSKDRLAEKKVRSPGAWIIAELEEHLGFRKRKPPAPRPAKVLTPEEMARKQLWAEIKAMEREDAYLCPDMSVPTNGDIYVRRS